MGFNENSGANEFGQFERSDEGSQEGDNDFFQHRDVSASLAQLDASYLVPSGQTPKNNDLQFFEQGITMSSDNQAR